MSLKIRPVTVFAVFIFCLGLLLRLWSIDKSMWLDFGYDEARDMLVAKHMVVFGETISVGPLAAGGGGVIANSPLYFYFVALIWAIGLSPISVNILLCLLMSTQVGFAYFIGKAIWDKKTGFIFMLLTALNPELIFESKNLYQPFFLPLLIMFFLFFFIKKSSPTTLSLAAFFLLLSLHFHYSIFLILPVGLGALTFKWIELFKKDKTHLLLFFPLTVCLMFLSWFGLIKNSSNFEIFLKPAESGHLDITSRFLSLTQSLTEAFWTSQHVTLLLILLFLAVVIPVRIVLDKNKGLYSDVIVFSLYVISTIPLLLFFEMQLFPAYFLLFLPFFLLLISLSIRWLVDLRKEIGIAALFFIAALFCFLAWQRFSRLPEISFYDEFTMISKKIEKDLADQHIGSDFTLALLSSDRTFFIDGWGTTTVWFLLEEALQKKLVLITDNTYVANHQPLVIKPEKVYYICEHRSGPSYYQDSDCLDKFTQSREFLSPQYALIHESPRFSVWKFDVIGAFPENFYRYY
jgi:hypothetical protein